MKIFKNILVTIALASAGLSSVFAQNSGIYYETYYDPSNLNWLWGWGGDVENQNLASVDFDGLGDASYGVGVSDRIDPDEAGAPVGAPHAIRFRGYIEIPTTGAWTFSTTHDESDGTCVYIDDLTRPILNTSGTDSSFDSATIQLEAGVYPIQVLYSTPRGGINYRLLYQGPGVPDAIEVPQAVLRPARGVYFENYLMKNDPSQLEGIDFDNIPEPFNLPIDTGISSEINANNVYTGPARFRGYIHIPTSGTWTFYLGSSDSSRLFFNNDSRPFIDNDDIHDYRELQNATYLESGYYPIEIQYLTSDSNRALDFSYEGPGVSKQEVPESALMPLNSLRGMYYEAYDVDLSSQGLAGTDFDSLTPVLAGISDQVNISQSYLLNSGSRIFAMRFQGYIYAPAEGEWTFNLASSGGSRLYLNGSTIPIIDNDGMGAHSTYATADLTGGYHRIEVQYFSAEDEEFLSLWYGANHAVGLAEAEQRFLLPFRYPQLGLSYSSYFLPNQDNHSNIDKAVDDMLNEGLPSAVGVTTKINTNRRPDEINFGIRFNGYIWIPTTGEWTFYLTSDDGSKLWIGDKTDVRSGDGSLLYVDNGTYKDNGIRERQASGWLPYGYHPISIDYYQAGGDYSLKVEYECINCDIPRQEIPAEYLLLSY